MQESDITKMKVADLKRELKSRGLATFGNKNELMERLQTAVVDGIDELLDESVLTDEDEANILGDDENDLLQSSTSLKLNVGEKDEDDLLLSPTTATVPKKVVLKRKNSFKDLEEPHTTKENTQPTIESKQLKMSERNPITVSTASSSNNDVKANMDKLSQKELFEKRAQKFGQSTKPATAASVISTNSSSEQIEKLKKRAERFGVVSPTVAKLDENERLLKRKERFGVSDAKSRGSATGGDVWAEKARQRLERFKTSTTATSTTEPK